MTCFRLPCDITEPVQSWEELHTVGFACSYTPLARWFTAVAEASGFVRKNQISGVKKQREIGEAKATSRGYVFMKMCCTGRLG